MPKVENFDEIRIKIASPQEILSWSHGEVTKPETINYRTQRPEKDGLFCERIFGPTKDYECYCGKYKRIRYKGIVCDRCGVEVTKSSVRRERMGHITLAAPVAHIWFLRGVPSRISLLLGKSIQEVEKVVYFVSYIVISVDENAKKKMLEEVEKEFERKKKEKKTAEERLELKRLKEEAIMEINSIKKGEILSEAEFRKFSLKYGAIFKAGTGAEAIRKIFEEMDLQKIEKELEEEYKKSNKEKRKKVRLRLNLVKKLISAEIRPEWMILTHLPVIPPDLRPMVQLDGGRYASSDLNDLYRRAINRNNRLKYLKEIDAPEIIQRNEKRMLQEAVDALIDNSARRKPQQTTASTGGKRELKSLADILKGKQGRFRQNLLGKRVDYSGRSVIVVGPELKIDEVGLPKKMALELFKPFIINKIIEKGLAYNVRGANILISEEREEVWEILEEIIEGKYVLLNRAPTLHRLSIQGFKPILIEGNAIQIHPLVCPAFNADFDGDQMAVFVPLSNQAQKEAKEIMVSTRGILKPATGKPIAVPRQEMILGCYYLTGEKEGVLGEGRAFSSCLEAKLAYEFNRVDLQAKIKVKNEEYFIKKGINASQDYIETTVGRIIFNDILPEDFPYQNKRFNSKEVQKLISELIENYSHQEVVEFLDKIKNCGFEFATQSATTWGMNDLLVPKEKEEIIKETEKEEEKIRKLYEEGFLSENERKDKIIEIWQKVKDEISSKVVETLPKDGSVFSIIDSGARGSWAQPAQMAGMKGLVANPAGETIELPIKKSYQEGLNTLEYFISTHGARKGTVDTALRTSSAGYLTRRLVDVAHEIIIREEDCKDKKGFLFSRKDAQEIDEDLSQKILGRIVLEDVKDKKGNIIVKKGEMIDEKALREIEKKDIESFRFRSPLSCKSSKGVCQKCYGMDLTTRELVKLGEAVGVVAAQAIGEPGTQLTMRTFHTGGVTGVGDITMGLPRVEEIFEVRTPKGEAPIFEEDGKVFKIHRLKNETIVEVKTKDTKKKKEYKIPAKVELLVKEGEEVFAGQKIIEGRVDIKKLFKAAGKEATQNYILKEIQKIYIEEGVAIHDKHIEIIIRQLFSRLKIIDPGDSDLLKGEIISMARFKEENKKLKKENKKPIKAKPIVLGITKVALSTDSFLSAASFQETSRVLIKASLEGKVDKLEGLKENVIIGKLIPAGTGFKKEKRKDTNS